MNKLKLQKIIAVMLAAISLSAMHISNANAAWVKDSMGWWNTEGNSWSIGWRMIDNEWYYFDSQGYMKTGWIFDGGKWYYLLESGIMARNTNIDRYEIGDNGAWIEKVETTNNNDNSNLQTNSVYLENEINIAESYVKSQKYKIVKNLDGITSYSLNKNMLYGSTDSIINEQIWSVQKSEPDKYFGKQIKVYGFTVENHPLEKIYNVNTNVYIMICDGQVIGGYSDPDNDSVGGVYSLDGKTPEEITGLNYSQLCEKWKEKYGK